MPPEPDAIAQRHLDTCARFGRAVAAAAGKWDFASPCGDWNAGDVLEHVIGFHDVLLLRPLGAKPDRPRDDPRQRWSLTVDALAGLFDRPGLFDATIAVPAVGNNLPTSIDARQIVPMLSQDVLIHTWDLARAVGADDRLDESACRAALDRLPTDDRLARSGMFAPPVPAERAADTQSQLLARLGRDPNWSADRASGL